MNTQHNPTTPTLSFDETEAMLAELSNAHGTSGFEGPVRTVLERHWGAQKIQHKVDKIGNLLGQLPAHSKDKPTVLLMAHMDEIGFIVSQIDEKGFIRVKPLGGWMRQVLWAQKWVITIGQDSLMAISGMDTPHIVKDREKAVADPDKLFLDTGLSRQELLDRGVRPGLPVTPAAQFEVLKSKKRYVGKALDDRIGLAAMIDVMKAIQADPSAFSAVNTVFAATVQEEIGLRGAQTVYESLKPDSVINIEFGAARDYPSQFVDTDQPELGKGPAIFAYDHSMIPDQRLLETVYTTARAHQIPFQWSLESRYGQDASCLQTAGEGIPCINIGIPVRYAHSHVGMMDREDYDHTVQLLLKTIINPGM